MGSASFGELLAGSSRGKSAGKKSGDGKVCLYDGVYSSKEYEAIATGLPKISEEKQAMVEQIVAIQVGWREEFAGKNIRTCPDRQESSTHRKIHCMIFLLRLICGENLRHILCRHWCSMEDVLWRLCRNQKI